MNTTPSSSARFVPTKRFVVPASEHLATKHPSPTSGRALVLGGGGSTGNAWLIGVVAGLLDGGVVVTGADLTIGTSAGSTAAAQFAGASPADLLTAILGSAAPQTSRLGAANPQRAKPVTDHLERLGKIIHSAGDPADMRRRIGAAALEMAATADPSWREQWRSTVASRLPSPYWPEQLVVITAVNATTGEAVLFDRNSGVDLVDAVAASCASGRPYRIDDNWYIDGGHRANAENADLAAGYGRVLVLSPFSGRSLQPVEWGTHLATQLEELRAGGSEVVTIFPTGGAEQFFGSNAMDLSLRPPAARSGFDQGRTLAGELTEFWQ